MEYKNILRVIPGLQATSLVMKNIPQKFPVKPSKKISMKKSSKPLIKRSVMTLVGIGLIKPTAQMINKL